MSKTTAQLLVEAESAYHDLQTGKAVTEIVDQNGERVKFRAADLQQLYLYIQSLRAQLTPVTVGAPINSPAGFIF